MSCKNKHPAQLELMGHLMQRAGLNRPTDVFIFLDPLILTEDAGNYSVCLQT